MNSASRFLAGLLACMAASGLVNAGTLPFDNLRVVPNPANSGQSLSLLVHWSGCGPQGATSVSVAGAIVRVTQTDSTTLCGTPPPSRDVTYALGSLAAGSYIARYVVDFSEPGLPDTTTDLPFVVAGTAATVALPAMSTPVAGLLALCLALVGWYGLGRRPKSGAGSRA